MCAVGAKWIDVCCPRGHFVGAVLVFALPAAWPPGWPLPPGVPPPPEPLLLMLTAVGRRHGMTPLLPGQRPLEARNGVTERGGPRGTVSLSCRRCPRFTLTRDYQRFAAELAAVALSGRAEYRC
jgi:hypothetical protein